MSREFWHGNAPPSRCLRLVIAVSALASTLAGCGWFDGKASPLQSSPLRPGAERQATVTGLPPAPNRGSYDAGVAPVDDGRSQPLGAIVTTKGGQKAQIEAAEKERAKRDAEREKERAEREAQRNSEKTEPKPGDAPPAAPPAGPAPAPAQEAPAPEPATPPAQR